MEAMKIVLLVTNHNFVGLQQSLVEFFMCEPAIVYSFYFEIKSVSVIASKITQTMTAKGSFCDVINFIYRMGCQPITSV